ncbi:hypothetical protein [Xylophilus sp. GOD-11R]|uniref:hypothetical protein n=1 Tax=Xylophilus sp. GOD-11R TaxID=3089814 RepID=UPI00298D5590|nr:hypothetical protein [Xylophilus sp. GOD-11R]WPB54936.1 hypothetical protein R9X41_12200 [Xylophilus sp. GOD-11R]
MPASVADGIPVLPAGVDFDPPSAGVPVLDCLPDRPSSPPSYASIYASTSSDGPSGASAPLESDDDSGLATGEGSCLDLLSMLTFDPVQRSVDELRAQVFADAEVAAMMREPKDMCFDCAVRVQVILNYAGVRNACRGLFSWTGTSDEAPETHFAILARICGNTWVVDPTAAQFPGCAPMLEREAVWSDRIAAASFGRAVLFRDFPNVAQARAVVDPLFRGSPLEFEGRVMNAPDWYKRIARAPDQFRAIRQRQAMQDGVALRRRMKAQARALQKGHASPGPAMQRLLFPPDYRPLRRTS